MMRLMIAVKLWKRQDKMDGSVHVLTRKEGQCKGCPFCFLGVGVFWMLFDQRVGILAAVYPEVRDSGCCNG